MAMLAEPRRRSKYSVDPRGLSWSKDEDKFGQKMLEKMGWKHGKGLGAQEHGMTDHIAVKHKFDNKGVGCSKSYADNWIAHQDDFNTLLSSLNETSDGNQAKDENAVSSLELKSKTSKGRVHYMKFTKGKDLSSKNNHDLDCVFGRRKSKSAPSTPTTLSETETSDSERNTTDNSHSEVDKSHGVITVKNNLSVSDYFAQKMLEVKNRLKKASDNTSVEMEQLEHLGQGSEVKEVHQGEMINMGCSSDDEKHGKGSKVTKDIGMIRSHTAPASLHSMVGAESDTDNKPAVESGAEGEKVKRKSKKGKKRKNIKVEGEMREEPEEMNDRPKEKRKAEKVGSEQVLVHKEKYGRGEEGSEEESTDKTLKKKRKKDTAKENLLDCDTDDALKEREVEADGQGNCQKGEDLWKAGLECKDNDTEHGHNGRSKKKKKKKKHEKSDKAVEAASGGDALGVVEVAESGADGPVEEDEGRSSESAQEEQSLGRGGTGTGDEGKVNSRQKGKTKKKKKQKMEEKQSEREDYVKIPSCVNKKRLREEQIAMKEAVRAEEKKKELGFVGSNLGDVVGYGRVDAPPGDVTLQDLTVGTKNKKKRAKKMKLV